MQVVNYYLCILSCTTRIVAFINTVGLYNYRTTREHETGGNSILGEKCVALIQINKIKYKDEMVYRAI